MTQIPAERGELGDVELHDRRLDQLRALTRLLDTALTLPGGFRIGLDPIIGLVPGLGDLVGAALSGYVILQSARLGAPRSLLIRMAANVGIETLAGVVPLIGDLFDFAWKANARNMALLESHLTRPAQTRRVSRRFVAVMVTAVLLLLAGAVVGAVVIFREAVQLLGGL